MFVFSTHVLTNVQDYPTGYKRPLWSLRRRNMCPSSSHDDVHFRYDHSLPRHDDANGFVFSAPIAYPIAKLLDYVLGADDHHMYKKAELKSFLQFHRMAAEEPLRDDEIAILNGVLELNTKDVEMIMTPLRVRRLRKSTLSVI